MNTAIASFLSARSSRVGRLAILAGAVALALSPLASCSKSTPAGGGGSPGGIDTCSPNVGNTSGNAVRVTSGTSYQPKICFSGTPNWFVITVPQGSTLLDVSAGYPANVTSGVTLEAKLFQKTNATTLTQLDDLVAPAQSDAGPAAGTIQTTFLVSQPGDYYVEVADQHNSAFDSSDPYTFQLTTATDPDSHEPNDTTATAKPSDGKPGWLAYYGDLDVFSTSAANATDLLTLTVQNPSTAPGNIAYAVAGSSGTTLTSGLVPANGKPFNTVVPVTAAGTYYVTLSYPAGTVPDRQTADGYSITFGSAPNPDATATNHTIATAMCIGGGSGTGGTGPCTTPYSGSAVTLPAQQGYLAVPGQKDFYRVDVTSGAPLVLQAKLTSSTTTVAYTIDLVGTDPGSACTQDTDCAGLNQPCTDAPTDCELSHTCMPAGAYHFCGSGSKTCQLCEGAGICVPGAAGGSGTCGYNQYISDIQAGGTTMGAANVSAAQPLFTAGSYYLVVHDAAYSGFDDTNPYTLTVQMAPEPDLYDRQAVAANRNNFYDPYPTANTPLSPSAARAIDITTQVQQAAAGGSPAPITGYISYQTDEDWFRFQHPCPGEDCGIDFSWLQPGPSNVQVAFFMLNQDLSLHESFSYTGSTPTTSLTSPAQGTFNNANGDCNQCSFASATVTTADAGTPYYYYMRITDVGQKAWDFSSTGEYNFSVTGITQGCPGSCSYYDAGLCTCWCTASNSCPAPTF
jgi:hypothetical protein